MSVVSEVWTGQYSKQAAQQDALSPCRYNANSALFGSLEMWAVDLTRNKASMHYL